MGRTFSALLILSFLGAAAFAGPQGGKLLPPPGKAVVIAGNAIYTIYVENDAASSACGSWTARTGNSHPAGPLLNVIFGGGVPGMSNTILRSYTSSQSYATSHGTASGCTKICNMVAPVATPILAGTHPIGHRLTWRFQDGANGPTIELVQEIVVVGPTNGTETVDNTVIRETHIVRNLGPGLFSFGLRKHWDWQIGGDDGPYFGDCATPRTACDRSMNLTADGSQNGPYPATYVINQNPVVTGCPNNVQPVTTTGCTGTPPYLVAGTVAPPSTLSPPPTAPELLQFSSWGSLNSSCWLPPLLDAASCGGAGADDTAVAYFYGVTQQTAITIAPNDERSFTQYVAAAREGCPAIVSEPPSDPCCPPWNASKLADMLFYDGSGSISDDYTLHFTPTPAFLAQIQAYIDYLFTTNSAMTAITIHFRVNDAGTGTTPVAGAQIGSDHWATWVQNGNGNPQQPLNFFSLAQEPMQVNRWYRIHTGIYLENGQSFFPASCADNEVDVRIQVQPHSLQPVIEMRRANGRVIEKPLRTNH